MVMRLEGNSTAIGKETVKAPATPPSGGPQAQQATASQFPILGKSPTETPSFTGNPRQGSVVSFTPPTGQNPFRQAALNTPGGSNPFAIAPRQERSTG